MSKDRVYPETFNDDQEERDTATFPLKHTFPD